MFNLLAEQWRRSNVASRRLTKAQALLDILQTRIRGVDMNPDACRIAAFSLYLALFEKLKPMDVEEFKGERLGRLDLRFKHRHSQRVYFAFEAKRLHVTYPSGKFSVEYTTYAGDDGLMAFVEGQYAKGFPACGMLGYVMDGDSDKACGADWSNVSNAVAPCSGSPQAPCLPNHRSRSQFQPAWRALT